MTDAAANTSSAVEAYVVTVEHNLVVAVARLEDSAGAPVPATKLEVGTQLAQNFRTHGCIDGHYHFPNAQRARVFANLCLEFTQALISHRLQVLATLAPGEEFHARDA